jgi:TP901 family phage tail tape measure protein
MANTEKIVVQVVVKGEKDLQRVGKTAGGGAKSFAKMAGAIALAGAAFSAINKQIGAAINTFKKFEFQMAKVKATTGATEKDFKKLNATAKQLGRTTFFTASQVGELQMNYAKLGFTTSEILDAQEATLRLATATGSDLARAAVVAGAAVRGFNLDASETERVVDVMAVAFTSSALDIEKWQTSMTKVAPIAAGAGVSIESTAAVMGKLTDAGIEASIAGTSMRNIFLKMQDSSSDLSQHLGFTVKSSADLEKALIQLNEEGLSNEEIMGLVDLRQVAAFATMVNGTASILDLTDALEDANGAAQEMADIMADTLEGDIITAKSAWEGFQIAIMTGSSNVSSMLRTAVKTWTFILNGWSDDLKSTEDVATDMFVNASKAAKEAVKEGERLTEVTGNKGWTTTLSRELEEEMYLLKQSLSGKEWEVGKSEDKLTELIGDGSGARINWYAQEIAEEREVLAEKTQIFEATEQAIKDLAEEVKVQKEKETTAIEVGNAKQFQADQQLIRDNKKAADKVRREKEKAAREALALEKQEFKESQEALKIALEEELNADKQNLIDGLITKEEFDLRVFEAEQAHLENMKNLNIAYGEDVSAINGQILDNELRMISEKAAAEAKTTKDKEDARQKEIDGVAQLGDQLINLAGEDEKMQGVKKAGIALSSAAAIANNIQALSEMTLGVTSQAKLPFPANIIGMVTTLSTVVSLLANIKAMKSAFGDGGVIETFANGGMVHGKSHAQGGEKFAVGGRVVELEGGEAVINKRSTAMFGSQLSAMNAAGGGVKFADGGLLNQPSFSQQQFNAIGQNQMMGAMGSSGKVVVVEADITDSQNSVSVIQSEATI